MFKKTNYKTILIIWLVLLSLLSYSFFTETILPVFKKGQLVYGVMGTAGFIILIGGSSLLIYGGYLFFIRTIRLFTRNERIIQNISVLRSRETSSEIKSQVRKENFRFLVPAWKPSFIYFGLALLLIVIGAVILNIAEGTINFN